MGISTLIWNAVLADLRHVKVNNGYEITFEKVPLSEVAVRAKSMPREFMNDEGNFPAPPFTEYITPLIDELPEFAKLEMKYING